MEEATLQAILKDMGKDIDRMKQEICVLKARVNREKKEEKKSELISQLVEDIR